MQGTSAAIGPCDWALPVSSPHGFSVYSLHAPVSPQADGPSGCFWLAHLKDEHAFLTSLHVAGIQPWHAAGFALLLLVCSYPSVHTETSAIFSVHGAFAALCLFMSWSQLLCEVDNQAPASASSGRLARLQDVSRPGFQQQPAGYFLLTGWLNLAGLQSRTGMTAMQGMRVPAQN